MPRQTVKIPETLNPAFAVGYANTDGPVYEGPKNNHTYKAFLSTQ